MPEQPVSPNADDQDTGLDEKTYVEERKLLIDVERTQSQNYDKYLLLLSGGALGLSLTFISQVARQAKPFTYPILFVGSWVAFGVTICGMLCSMLLSQKAYQKQRDIVDAAYTQGRWPAHERITLSKWVWWLNLFSGIAFLVGAVLLGLFVSRNLS